MFSTLTRIVRRCMLSYKSCLRNYSKGFVDTPSALYTSILIKDRFSLLDPYMDINHTFGDREKLKLDLEWRNIHVDVDFLYQESIRYEKVITLMELTRNNINKLKAEKNKLPKDNNLIRNWEKSYTEQKNILENTTKELVQLEETFVLPYLRLPNSLHKNTTQRNECLFTLFPKPEFAFPAKSHIQIGVAKNELHFKNVSPSSYYLQGKLAVLELAVSEFFMTRFQEHDFKSYSNADTARAILAEGCGFEVRNNEHLQIEDNKCLAFNQVQFLFGGSSLPSYVALLCKGIVNFSKDVPFRLVSTGRKYNLADWNQNAETSLFNAIQSNAVSAFVLYPLEIVEEALVNEIAMLLNQTYTEFGLHFKLIQYSAAKLKAYESLGIGLFMYSPFASEYIEVGRISLCHDYISKRLQIYKSMGKEKAAFLGMIYVEVVDVRKWIGCLIENTQSEDGRYSIPQCLHPFMLGQT